MIAVTGHSNYLENKPCLCLSIRHIRICGCWLVPVSKGKTLRTALPKKAETPLSQAPVEAGKLAPTVLDIAVTSLEDSKAEEIVAIDIRKKSSLGDHMIVASGRSHRHVAAIADHLVRALKENGSANIRIEGMPSADWVLIDAADVIIHIFRPEVREFYNIEKMWQTPELDEDQVH